MTGAVGDDVLSGGAATTRSRATTGNDTLNGDAGNDILDGGQGTRRLSTAAPTQTSAQTARPTSTARAKPRTRSRERAPGNRSPLSSFRDTPMQHMNSIKLKRVEMFKVGLQAGPSRCVAAHGTIGSARSSSCSGVGRRRRPRLGRMRRPAEARLPVARLSTPLGRPCTRRDPGGDEPRVREPRQAIELSSVCDAPNAGGGGAVEMAAWDMIASRQGRSCPTSSAARAATFRPAARSACRPPARALAALVEQARRDGYQRIKIKIEPSRALSLASEASRLQRESLSSSTPTAASRPIEVQKLRELDASTLAWIEQPYPTHRCGRHRAAARHLADARGAWMSL